METKSVYLIVGLAMLLMSFNGFFVRADSDCTPALEIPENYILSFYVEDGIKNFDSYFKFNITEADDIIPDGDYHGWCVQRDEDMTRDTTHSGDIYSSYDLDMDE